MKRLTKAIQACLGVVLGIAAATSLQAAISVGPNGSSGNIAFNSAPVPADWATASIAGGAGDVIDAAGLNTAAQTVTAAAVMTQLPTTATVIPADTANALARFNSTRQYLQSRSTGVRATLLMARVQNNTGSDANQIIISYEYGAEVAADSTINEHVPGQLVYYSLTGEAQSWIPIPELSTGAAGPQTVTIPITWPAGAVVYILWADDNGPSSNTAPQREGHYTIDNAMFATQIVPPEPATIAVGPADTTVQEPNSVTFTVAASGTPPLSYQWFYEGTPITDATNTSYTIPRVFVSNAGTYSVQVSNPYGSATSNAVLTVIPDQTPPSVDCAYGTNDNLTIYVVFSEIVTNANDAVNYSVFPSGDPMSPLMIASAVYPGGATEGRVVILTLDPQTPLAPGGTYSMTASTAFDLVGNQIDPNEVTRLSLYAEFRFAISTSQIWTFNDTGDDLGTAWRNVGYDDSGWKSGPALIGFEPDPIPEPLRTPAIRTNAAGQVIRTFYFRSHFDYPGPAGEGVLRFRLVLDDAAAIYLNGAEVFRIRLPAGPLNYLTPGAGGAVGNAVYEGPFTVCVSNLVQGDNLLAVEVHQTGDNSSDMVWGMELFTVAPSITPVSIITQPTGTNVLEPAPFSLRVLAGGSNPNYQWYRNGSPIDGATNATYSVNPSDCNVHGGPYHVVVFNDAPSSVTSSTVTVGVGCDDIKPTVACLYGTNDTIVVVFSEMTTNGTEVFNYIIEPVGGGSPLALSSATYTTGTSNGTTVLLVIDPSTPRDPNVAYTINIQGIADMFDNYIDPVTLNIPLFPSPPIIGINATQVWRYDDSGTDRTNLWRAVGYDDSGWRTGNALFDALRGTNGTLGVDCRNVVNGQTVRTCLTLSNATGTAQIPTVYFRTHFNYSGGSAAVLAIRPFIDDGAVYYLNGVEILRVRMPATLIQFSTLASATVGSANFEGPFYVCVTNLVNGDNVLAVELHQGSLTSSDLTFGTEIVKLNDAPAARLTIAPGPTPGKVTISWTGSGVLEASDDLSAHPSGWNAVPNVTGNSYETDAVNNRFFRLAPAQ